MKKTSLLILLAVVLSFTPVFKSAAQTVPVNLNLQNVTLEQVLNDIEKQTSYLFVYNRNINVSRLVSVNADQKNLRDVLAQLFSGTDINYSVEGTNIVLSQRAAGGKPRAISGRVTDQNGSPLPGVSVVVKGSNTGTATGGDGMFNLNIGENAQILQFSFLGMESREVPIDNQHMFNVALNEQSFKIEGVVVTALGITKENRSLSYNVQSIASDEFTTVKDATFINALAGKVAGMQLNASSSGAGGSSRVILRGTKSINRENNALYVIDGMPMPQLRSSQPGSDFYSGAGQSGDGISNINPEDIESMSVLSGPAASALYGYEGANGVIIINTKKGAKDGLIVNLSNSTMFSSPFVMPKFQNTYGPTEQGSFYSWGDKLSTPSSYSPKDFFRTGFNTTNSVSLSVGGERNQTFVSVGTVTAGGIIPNNDYDRFNFTFRNTSDFLNDKVTLDLSFMYAGTDEQNMLSQGQYSNPLIPLYLFPPGDDIAKYQTYERYDPERYFKTQFWPFGDMGHGMQNPWWIVNRNMFNNRKDRYMVSATARYKVTEWFNVTGRARMDNDYMLAERKYSASTWAVITQGSNKGFYHREDATTKDIYADVMGNFEFGNRCYSFSANVGASIRDTRFDQAFYSGGLLAPNMFSYMNIVSGQKPTQDRTHDQVQSVFATAQVGYGKMLYLDLTGRSDWDSRLWGSRTLTYFYPSVGLSAVVTDILGMQSSQTLSFLKMRLAYAEVGNPPQREVANLLFPQDVQQLPRAVFYAPFTTLKPERTNSWEAGFNAVLWKKLKLDATVYHSTTFNQVVRGTLPPTTSFAGYYLNIGDVSNKGVEASISLKQNLGPVLWNTTAVFSLNRNRINHLTKVDLTDQFGVNVSFDRIDIGGTSSYAIYLYEGRSMNELYVNGLETDDRGYIYVNPANNAIRVNTDPPHIYAGKMDPNYLLSWRNDFEWKGINMGCMFSARVGGVGISVTQALMDGFGTSEASARARDGEGVFNVNGYAIPAYNYYSVVGSGQHGVGAMYVYDATNVRLSEAYIGYDIPFGPRASKVIKGLNVSLIGRNLLMIYNKAPFDPEITASTGTYFTGVDYFMQPSLRSIGFSTKLTF